MRRVRSDPQAIGRLVIIAKEMEVSDHEAAGITRRTATMMMAATLLPLPAGAAEAAPIVELTTGRIRGTRVGPVNRFLGIPYAASIAGRNRFMPPQPVASWSGIRDALQYGPSSPQQPGSPLSVPFFTVFNTPPSIPNGEDCLVLNVWAPARPQGKVPVMVWLHGGGFTEGSGSGPAFDGTNLASRGDVILITVNHRLGASGYTDFSRVVGGPFADSANVGMRDIVAALQWVNRNIAAFGGDPSRVMIFGQSGGGGKVSTLLAMPSAKGLFSRAAIMGGPMLRGATTAQADDVASLMLKELGVTKETATQLWEMPIDRIVAAEVRVAALLRGRGAGLSSGFSPVVDGTILPTNMFDPVAAPTSLSVPTIVGQNATEWLPFSLQDTAAFSMDRPTLEKRSVDTFGKNGTEMVAIYRRLHPNDNPTDTWFRILSDSVMTGNAVTLADTRSSAGGAPVFAYRFDWFTRADGGKMRSSHALELPFFFDNATVIAAEITGGGPRAARLGKTMSSAWVNFAKTGRPSAATLPAWPIYTPGRRLAMHFDDRSFVAPYVEPRVAQILKEPRPRVGPF